MISDAASAPSPPPARDVDTPCLRVGLVGFGSIGGVVGRVLADGGLAGVCLGGVVDPVRAPEESAVPSLHELIESNDAIVEAAGPQVVAELTPLALAASRTLIAVSVGAFLSPGLQPFLTSSAQSGRLIFTTGAITGLDVIRAARMADGSTSVRLRSTKKPSALAQPWMTESERADLLAAAPPDGPRILFRGPPTEAARLFPANLNVAAALAIAAGDPASVEVELVADPSAERTRHEVHVSSALGEHRLELENFPSIDNPATSGLVPWAVLRCLLELSSGSSVTFR